MLKTITAAWRLHSVLDSALSGGCGNAMGSSRAPWARCGRNMNSNKIIIMNANGTVI